MKFASRLFTAMLGVFLLAASTAHAATVVIGYVNHSSYEVTAQVYRIVLERSGYNVAMKQGPASVMLPMLANGDLDLFVAATLPDTDSEEWSEYGENLSLVSPVYTDAKLFWAVPAYVPADSVSSVADLAKPDVAAKMVKTIRGPGSNTRLMIRSTQLMDAYALSQAGYELAPGTTKDWVDLFNDNMEAKNWFVMPLWQPQYLNKVAKLRILKEPENILGATETAWLVANKASARGFAEHIFAMLQRMEFTVKNITDLDYTVNVEGTDPRETAHRWMANHPYTVEYWITPD
ncbi:MAG: glycine betaine ABC transporter substrate-binding protein [Burkholderiales bacterium]|jgi:glycine betaine/proline transport system substrate-binding protein